MEIINRKKPLNNQNQIQNSFEKDYKRFHNEINSELKIEKKAKKLITKSTQNIRDEILTGELKFRQNSNDNIS